MKKNLKTIKIYELKGDSNGEKCLSLFSDFMGCGLIVKWTGLE